MNWIPVAGRFESNNRTVVFHGESVMIKDEQGQERPGSALGLIFNDSTFTGGEITARAQLEAISDNNACELVVRLGIGLGVRAAPRVSVSSNGGMNNTRSPAQGGR